jgi:hypothetical protein
MDCIAIAQLLRIDCKVIVHRLRNVCAVIRIDYEIDCTAILHHLCIDRKVIAQRSHQS